MFCGQCGHANVDTDRFCVACGVALVHAVGAPAPVHVPVPVPPPISRPAPAPREPEPPPKPERRVTLALEARSWRKEGAYDIRKDLVAKLASERVAVAAEDAPSDAELTVVYDE